MEQLILKLFNITESNYKKQIIFTIVLVTFVNFTQLRLIQNIDTYVAIGTSIKISCFTFPILFWVCLFAGGYSFRKNKFQSLKAFKYTIIGSFSYVAVRFTNDMSEDLCKNFTIETSRAWLNAIFQLGVMGLIMLGALAIINYYMEILNEYLQKRWIKK